MRSVLPRVAVMAAVTASMALVPSAAIAAPNSPPPASKTASCVGIATSENATTLGGTAVAAIIDEIRDFYGQAGRPLAFYARLHQGSQADCNTAVGA